MKLFTYLFGDWVKNYFIIWHRYEVVDGFSYEEKRNPHHFYVWFDRANMYTTVKDNSNFNDVGLVKMVWYESASEQKHEQRRNTIFLVVDKIKE